ncbi:MAG TPA: alkaline phosphatase family protein [Burkholderiales bacterium]|nr:alkaline phosphatase family protein [Burkholderiales bacterium]
MMRPDYAGGSIVNLMASLGQALGADAGGYAPLPSLPPAALEGARNLVLLVLDGMGSAFLERAGGGSVLAAHRRGVMTSVFPPTTATAITAFMTGVAPQQHGLTGWFTWLKETASVVAVLPFQARHGGGSLRASGLDPARVFTARPFVDMIPVKCFGVCPREIAHSDFNSHHAGGAEIHPYDGLGGLFSGIETIVRSGSGGKYVYAYYPGVDSLAHVFGIGSPQVASLFSRLDDAFGAFLKDIAGTDTAVVVTADHGFVDVPPGQTVQLESHPRLAETLVLPLCGEPRVAYCYVHPDRRGAFESYVGNELAQCATLIPSAELLAGNWFGLGPPHPRLAERIGHYALVMHDGWAVKDWVLGERRHHHIGCHGGVSADEMLVPLIIARA